MIRFSYVSSFNDSDFTQYKIYKMECRSNHVFQSVCIGIATIGESGVSWNKIHIPVSTICVKTKVILGKICVPVEAHPLVLQYIIRAQICQFLRTGFRVIDFDKIEFAVPTNPTRGVCWNRVWGLLEHCL